VPEMIRISAFLIPRLPLLGTKQRDRFTVSCTPTGEQLLLTGDYTQKLDMHRDSIPTDGLPRITTRQSARSCCIASVIHISHG